MDDNEKQETIDALEGALDKLKKDEAEAPTPAPDPVVEEPAPEPKLTKTERFFAMFTLLRQALLSTAELIDAFRVVPRFILTLYGILIYQLYTWYTAIETTVQTKCDEAILKLLMDHGETLVAAQEVACYVADHVGGPTTAQTTFVTTIIGLATPMFAFYTNTGKKWKTGGDKE